MEQKPIDGHYDPQGKLRLLGGLVQVLIIVMILGISIIVAIIVKEFFIDTEKKTTKSLMTPTSLTIPKNSKVESIYTRENRLYLVVSSKNEKQEIIIIELEDGVEISRESVRIHIAE